MHVDTVVPSFDFTGWAPLADLTAHVAQTGSCPFEVVCQRLLVNWKVDAAWAVLAFGRYLVLFRRVAQGFFIGLDVPMKAVSLFFC